MTSRQLEALRKHLHFTVPEAARWVAASPERPRGVEERTWNRWESGKVAVPPNIAERICELVRWRDDQADSIWSSLWPLLNASTPLSLIWYDYREDWPGDPAHWRPMQSAMAELLTLAVRDGNADSLRLVPFDSQAYHAWRLLAGHEDLPVARAEWARLQPDDTPPPRMVEMHKDAQTPV